MHLQHMQIAHTMKQFNVKIDKKFTVKFRYKFWCFSDVLMQETVSFSLFLLCNSCPILHPDINF